MVQQTIDSKISEYGLCNPENNMPNSDKQPPVAVKKTPLRDLQNKIRTVANSNVNSSFSKDNAPVIDAIKVAGAKRSSPEPMVNPCQYHPPSTNAANGHLVYVRRKPEAELGKSSPCDSISMNGNCPHPRQVGHFEEANQQKPQMNEHKVSLSAFKASPMTYLLCSSAKPSVPLPLGKSVLRVTPPESNQNSVASAAPSLGSPKGNKKLHWEERYHELQMLLKNLDEMEQEEYVQTLRSLSSVELSRHAVELEKRSIQLSLEEAKEVQRVGILMSWGKP